MKSAIGHFDAAATDCAMKGVRGLMIAVLGRLGVVASADEIPRMLAGTWLCVITGQATGRQPVGKTDPWPWQYRIIERASRRVHPLKQSDVVVKRR